MSRWTRRDVLKSGLAASAGALTANAWPRETRGDSSVGVTPDLTATADAPSPRERLLMDFGWRFHLGHANDPAKDFGFGLRRREGQFAKSGNFLPVTRL